MEPTTQQRDRKVVPRFRRRGVNERAVDIDDYEAQARIEKDLESHYIWTSDTTDTYKQQFDNQNENESIEKQLWLTDETIDKHLYDIQDENEQRWRMNIEQIGHEQQIKWTDDEQSNIILSLGADQEGQHRWALDDLGELQIKWNDRDQDRQQNKHDLDTITGENRQNFLHGDEFRNQIQFALNSEKEHQSALSVETEDIRNVPLDTDLPSTKSNLSLPQAPLVQQWLAGIAHYALSLPASNLSQQFAPLTNTKVHLDSNSIPFLPWSLELLKQQVLASYVLSLPNQEQEQFSLPEIFRRQLSMYDNENKQLFSLPESSLTRTISLSSDDIQRQILSIIDSLLIEHHFGEDEPIKTRRWSISELETLIQTISPLEILNLFYSPKDAQQILLEHLLIESDEISARAFRRARCKHMSIKCDGNNQLDCIPGQGIDLEFKGNERIAVGEEQIQNDLDEQQDFRDGATSAVMIEDPAQTYDLVSTALPPTDLGPCLYRSDYERDPPPTWSRLRREIGSISYDASLAEPIYHLDKSCKRFAHIPAKRDGCSYDVHRGYSEFIEKVQMTPDGYFRSYDSTDLRPLLSWYSNKQYLFSTTNKDTLKPPTFICRRLVLRTILANLYCDSDPWKVLVVRIKGQFYLAMANRASKRVEDLTEDEYSGYKFEALFTSNQPNTTRSIEKIPLEKPQEQYHTVQYWRFGEFNLLYSNEIDAEIRVDMQEKPKPIIDPVEQVTTTSTTKETEPKTSEVNYWDVGEVLSTPIEPVEDEPADESKQAQIDENLQVTATEESPTVEEAEEQKKKPHDHPLKSGYIELKCTNRKVLYRDENKLKTLHWWAQMWLANTDALLIGYRTPAGGIVDHLELLSLRQLVSKFIGKYDLRLKYCLAYLHSFLRLIQQTVVIDDPNTVHAFAYVPQPLEIDPMTGKPVLVDLPTRVPFRYTQMKRSNERHAHFLPDWYLEEIQRAVPKGGFLQDENLKTIEQETKKRVGHRGRASCVLKQQQQPDKRHPRKKTAKGKKSKNAFFSSVKL